MQALRSPRVLALVLLALSLPLRVHALTPAHIWSRAAGGTLVEEGYGVAMDDSKNIYVTGSFQGTVDFGTGPLTSAGGTDIFVAAYDSLGVPRWSRRFGGTGDDAGNAIEVSNYVWLTGYIYGFVTFDTHTVGASGLATTFVSRLDGSTGTNFLTTGFGATTTACVANGLSTYANGDYGITGYFTGNLSLSQNFINAGGQDIFVGQIQSGLGVVARWFHAFGSTGDDRGRAVKADVFSNLFAAGSFGTTINLGGGPMVSAGGTDAYLVKFDSNGNHLWSKQYGDNLNDAGNAVGVDFSGNVFVAGTLGNKKYLVKLAPDGSTLWSKSYSTLAPLPFLTPYGVAVDDSSGAIVAGQSFGLVDLGAGSLFSPHAAMFIAKFAANGSIRWFHAFTAQASSGSATAYAVASTQNGGSVSVTGSFIQPTSFGGSVLNYQGTQDVFVARYASASAEPIIGSIEDIGNDQGRAVKVRFNRSGYDLYPSVIDHYEIYRKDAAPPPALPMAAASRGPAITGWTQVGRVDAHADRSYGVDVPTIGDSTLALGQYRSTFRVRAATEDRLVYYDSPPDSGYSLDNLAPAIPFNFVYGAGSLSWGESPDADFKFFTVYGASTNSFASATVVDYSTATSMDVQASPYTYYFVTATDFSGNEGRPAVVHATSGVDGTPASYILSVSNYPNPFNPRTTVKYTVPSRGHVSVRVFDAHGALVATLFNGERNAGAYSIDWDGRTTDAAGAASGVYFARIEHDGATRTKKMVLLK